MICCLFSGGIIISCFSSITFVVFSEVTFNEVILSAIFDPIKSPVASADI